MESLSEARNRAGITPRRFNPLVRELRKRQVLSGDGIIQVNETPAGTAIRLAVDVLLARLPKVTVQLYKATADEDEEAGTITVKPVNSDGTVDDEAEEITLYVLP